MVMNYTLQYFENTLSVPYIKKYFLTSATMFYTEYRTSGESWSVILLCGCNNTFSHNMYDTYLCSDFYISLIASSCYSHHVCCSTHRLGSWFSWHTKLLYACICVCHFEQNFFSSVCYERSLLMRMEKWKVIKYQLQTMFSHVCW